MFRTCIYDIEAWAEPASGDYQTFSGTHAAAVPAGHPVRLRLGFSRYDEPGRWFVTSVTAWQCGTGRLVQLDGDGASFTVATR